MPSPSEERDKRKRAGLVRRVAISEYKASLLSNDQHALSNLRVAYPELSTIFLQLERSKT